VVCWKKGTEDGLMNNKLDKIITAAELLSDSSSQPRGGTQVQDTCTECGERGWAGIVECTDLAIISR
jgi:hypothetical protein